MSVRELIQRYCIFTLGIIFTAMGIALTTRSMLGTSPISAIPYSLSVAVPVLTLGNWTIIFNGMLAISQIFILRKALKKVELVLQLIATIPFGFIIDFWNFCFSNIETDVYPLKLLCMVAGCFVVAMGVYFQFMGGVVMLPGDAFVRAIARVTKKEFGKVRTISDITMATIAFGIVLIFTGGLSGMREGTIIAAFLVGNIVRLYKSKLKKIERFMLHGCKYN